MLNDETLARWAAESFRSDPRIEEKIEILHLMEALGIETVNIGLPGAGPRAYADVEALAREIVQAKLKIRPNCAARTHRRRTFVRLRRFRRRWELRLKRRRFWGAVRSGGWWKIGRSDHLARTTEKAVKFAVAQGLPVMYVTEDTIRTDPDDGEALYIRRPLNAERGRRCCATRWDMRRPAARIALVKFVRDEVVKPSGEKIRVDWHGHNDRGLAVANSFAAILAGADQVHAAANALGERVGNTPMELMLVNLRLLGLIDRDLSRLKEYCETVARATQTDDSAELSGDRARCFSDRDGRACGGDC